MCIPQLRGNIKREIGILKFHLFPSRMRLPGKFSPEESGSLGAASSSPAALSAVNGIMF
jgi:hypothetical protein